MDFHGSYLPEDCIFLLKPVQLAPTDVKEKERRIQSGKAHYSTMLSAEKAPDPRYLDLFEVAFQRNEDRFARDLATLAKTLAAREGDEVVIVSLARAGTPVGVLLRRALTELGRKTVHYSISIIRDRGIDAVALDYILARHSAENVVFVDGWTGKGAIATELHASVSEYNQSRGVNLDTSLAVVVDLAGVAPVAVTDEDYLIPSSILNAVVSGLVSRTVLNDDVVGPGDFHACVFYTELAEYDLSRAFVDRLTPTMFAWLPQVNPVEWTEQRRAELKATSDRFVADIMARFHVVDRNRVKPGIGESTRALMRRMPERLIVVDENADDLQHLVFLAKQKGLPINIEPNLPYRAAVVIATLGLDG